ncbi:hypothetical protein [Rhodonellum sp.]|uniref:hypothetical protein n=1 Tax=Rhodonellum sp. TaxID=2231180 RepID=UPI00271D066E|nr:hypothetical protein [Rhodonellum sp.]MDO9554730.1 hypothetical protein [Rhodonellum sp.]
MKRFTVSFLILLFPFLLPAQQLYSGAYTFNGLKGESVFEFIQGKNEEVIKDGNFQFFRKQIDTLDNTIFYSTEIIGQFQNNLKSGIWEYEDERHNVVLKDIEDFKVVIDLNSEQFKLKSSYSQGIPDGRWAFVQNEFSEGKLKPKAQAEEIRFKKGDIVGKFQYKEFNGKGTHFIRGEVLEGGLMNGEWTLVYEDGGRFVSEIRKYEKGFLLGLVKRDLENDSLIEELVFFKTIEKLQLVNNKQNSGFRIADEKFGLFFNDGFLEDYKEVIEQNSGNAFISSFLRKILKFDEAFVNAEGLLIETPIHTKRFVFEINRDDQSALVGIPLKYNGLKEIVTEYSEKNALALNRFQSDSLAKAHAFFQLYKVKITQLGELVKLFDSKDIQYFDLGYFEERRPSFLSDKDLINFTFGDEEIQKTIEYTIDDQEKSFFALTDSYLDQMVAEVERQKSIVDFALRRIEKNEGLRNLEKNIQVKKEAMVKLYSFDGEDGFSSEEKSLVEAIRVNILTTAFNRLNENYAKEDDFELKNQAGQVILDLLSEMEIQHPKLLKIHAVNATLDDLYMEEVFNPFTYTRYDQRVKERLFEAGQKVFEYYLDQIKSEQEYTEIKTWLNKIEKLNVRMLELYTADTRRLERRLNRRESISGLKSLLDL